MPNPHTHIDTPNPAKTNGKKPCNCEEPPPPTTCCELVCPERPRYFCGHLLTDDDLATEQRYVIEKHKLFNRTLHGHGVVCGLRLTCHHECAGHIRIGKGYAIDDCGHDLIVCEPASFNVVARLREKGLLIETKPPDPCKPQAEEPECKIRQCFPIVICYREEETEYETPFIAGCRPQLIECEATRVRETFYFDVLDELPKTPSWLDQIQERIQECSALFTKGPFAQALNDGADLIGQVINEQINALDQKAYADLFCKLKQLLLLYLSKHPDDYHCTLPEDLGKIQIPAPHEGDVGAAEFGEGAKKAFCRLLELAYQHVISCILGQVIFDCPEPCKASCVVLGTVELDEHGRVVRVCNCPRDYVLSFASLFQALTAKVLGGLACENERPSAWFLSPGFKPAARHDDENGHRHCCREFEFDCNEFARNMRENQQKVFSNTTALFQALNATGEAFRYAFDFTQPDFIPSGLFVGKTPDEAQREAKLREINLEIEELPAQTQLPDPVATLLGFILPREKQPIVAYARENRILGTVPIAAGATIRTAEREKLKAEIQKSADAEIEKHRQSFNEQLAKLEDRLKQFGIASEEPRGPSWRRRWRNWGTSGAGGRSPEPTP